MDACMLAGGKELLSSSSVLPRQTNDWQLTSATLRRLNAESPRIGLPNVSSLALHSDADHLKNRGRKLNRRRVERGAISSPFKRASRFIAAARCCAECKGS